MWLIEYFRGGRDWLAKWAKQWAMKNWVTERMNELEVWKNVIGSFKFSIKEEFA